MATKQPELPAPSEAVPKTKRVADPELQAISEITKHMAALDAAAQTRVMAYLNARYDQSRVAKPNHVPLMTAPPLG